MIIRYDYQAFCSQSYGGISRYFYELITGFKSYPDVSTRLNVLLSDNIYIQRLQGSSFIGRLQFMGKKDSVRLLNRYYDRFIASRQPHDIFHPTYYDPPGLKLAGNKPFVITIHDLIDERFHLHDPAFKYLIQQRQKYITRADKIIAVSENTKNDLVDLCHADPAKIEVIYHGNTLKTPVPRRSLTSLFRQPYLLYTGKRYSYKNFTRFIKASAPLLHANKELCIVCGGGGIFSSAEQKLFGELQIQDRVFYCAIAHDETLQQLYNHAELFIYPSEYEGFGFPIIEAFNCGCPVITSYGSSTQEIGAAAAAYITPTDESMISAVIQNLLFNKNEQEKLTTEGYRRAAFFSWKKTLEQTYRLYKSLL